MTETAYPTAADTPIALATLDAPPDGADNTDVDGAGMNLPNLLRLIQTGIRALEDQVGLTVPGVGTVRARIATLETAGYLTSAAADLLYDALGAASSAVSTHAGLADPHTGYQLEIEKGAASGYAPLDASSLLADSFIPSTIARDAEVTAAVNAAIAALINAAPATLDTLDEIAAALGDDPNFATTIANLIGAKLSTSLFDAHTILAATSDDTPAALTVAEQTMVGRVTGGNIAALTAAQVRTLLALGGAALLNVGTTTGTVAAGDDTRLSDARTPTAHAASHADGGTDEVTLTTAQVTDLAEYIRDTIGTAAAAGTGVTITVDDAGNLITISSDPAGYGKVTTGGHSYTQLGGGGTAAADAADAAGNFTRRVASVLNAPSVVAWGKSGAQLRSPHGGSAADVNGVSGLGLWQRFLYPNHWYAPRSGSHSGIPTRPAGKANPGLYVFDYGYNDVLACHAANGAGLLGDTFENHLRTLVARAQAAMVYDSTSGTVAYSGFGTTVNTEDSGHAYLACTGTTWRKSTTNADYVEVTLPAEFTGGTVYLTFIAPTNMACYLSTALTDTVGTTVVLKGSSIIGDLGYKILTAGDLILIGTEKITLGATADGGITWTGCTRGAAGSTAATHAVNDSVTMPVDQIRVDFAASTAPGASGAADLALAGQGLGADGVFADAVRKSPGFVTKLFALTAADAGLKIRATVEGKQGNEFAGFDQWGIIDPDPPSVILVDQPDMGGTMPGGGTFYTGATATDLNGRMGTVAAEFTACAVADASGVLEARYKATVQTAISSGATTTLHVTPVDATLCEINDGTVLRVLGASAVETMLVTAITKTSDTDWSLTVTRNYDGAGAQTTIAIGQTVMDRVWLAPDWIHPSDLGHQILTEAVLAAVRTLPRTAGQAANAGDLPITNPRHMPDGYFLLVIGGTRNTQVWSANLSRSYRFVLDAPSVVTAVGIEVTTGAAAGGVFRAGIRADGPGIPGKLIADLGTAVTTGTGVVEVTGFVPLRPGVYWIEAICQTQNATVRGHASGQPFPAVPPLMHAAAPSGSALAIPTGVDIASISGALASAYPAGSSMITGQTPIVWVRLDTPDRD